MLLEDEEDEKEEDPRKDGASLVMRYRICNENIRNICEIQDIIRWVRIRRRA